MADDEKDDFEEEETQEEEQEEQEPPEEEPPEDDFEEEEAQEEEQEEQEEPADEEPPEDEFEEEAEQEEGETAAEAEEAAAEEEPGDDFEDDEFEDSPDESYVGDGDGAIVEETEVEEKGFGGKLKDSVSAMVIGLILFVASFFILYKGETRVNRAKIVQKATAIQPDASAKAADGKTIKFSGAAATTAPVTDPEYLPGGQFAYLARSAEMYAWTEKSETKTKTSGGKKKQVTRTWYEKDWTSMPSDSSRFKKPSGHQNPTMTVKSKTWAAAPVTVGDLTVTMQGSGVRIMGAEDVAESAPKQPAKAFDPMAPEGSGPVTFSGTPSAATPVTTKRIKDKKLLLSVTTVEVCDNAGKWVPGAPTVKAAKGVTVGKVAIDTSGIKADDLPGKKGPYYGKGIDKKKPKSGDKRMFMSYIELGVPVTFSGQLSGAKLANVTVSGFVAAGRGAAKSRWYIGKGSVGNPKVGDIRLTFAGIEPGANLFVCGKLNGTTVEPTVYKDITYQIVAATTEAEVLSQLQSEHKIITWICRIGGFLAMWIGMCLMIGPLTFLLSYIPVLGGLASGLLNFVFGVIALVLTLLTILLVRLFWILLVLALAAVVWGIMKKMSGAKPATP
ncbi:hypothetical protein H8D79_00630 [PVC group bacterium]|nr:hypothetical protein [PVC group bacterium]